MSCLRCFMECYERFIKYLSKNTYIHIALTGHDFCTASKEAYHLIHRNAQKYSMVSGFGQVINFIGKVFISCFTTFICYVIIISSSYYSENLFSPLFPTIGCLIVSYIVGNLFMSLYGNHTF